MEAVRRFIDAEELMSILALPENYRNHKLEIIVIPSEEKIQQDMLEKRDILKSLLGAIPTTNLSLEELRSERLNKYEMNNWH